MVVRGDTAERMRGCFRKRCTDTTADVAPAANVVYTVRGTVASNATGSISNTANVMPPADVTDPDLGNNGATTPDQPVTREADLSITKTLSTSPVVAGNTVAYTIEVTNLGPSAEFGATVTDTPPATLTNVAWTCTATPPSSCVRWHRARVRSRRR